MELDRRFLHHLRCRRLLAAGARVAVACSGGGDSTALVHLLYDLRRPLPLELTVIHVDHGLRGAESRADADFVEALATRLRLPFDCRRLDPADLRRSGESLQARAREARRTFFDEVYERRRLDWVVTAHHGDDVAETVLMNLLKGSARPLGIAERRGYLLRPLLPFTHEELVRYLRQRGLSWREDSSNADHHYLRNRVRHNLVPLLEESFNPALSRVLGHTAQVLEAEEDYLEEQLAPHLALFSDVPAGYTIAVASLRDLPLALRRRLIRTVLHRLGLVKELSFVHIEAVLELLERVEGSGRVDLPEGVCGERRYDRLLLTKASPLLPAEDFEVAVAGMEVELPAIDSTLRFSHGERPSGAIGLRSDLLEGRLTVRSPRPGDRFQPAGMGGHHKRLAALFVDAKVPVAERSRVPVLECEGTIVAVGTMRAAHGFAAAEGDAETLWLRYTPRQGAAPLPE